MHSQCCHILPFSSAKRFVYFKMTCKRRMGHVWMKTIFAKSSFPLNYRMTYPTSANTKLQKVLKGKGQSILCFMLHVVVLSSMCIVLAFCWCQTSWAVLCWVGQVSGTTRKDLLGWPWWMERKVPVFGHPPLGQSKLNSTSLIVSRPGLDINHIKSFSQTIYESIN